MRMLDESVLDARDKETLYQLYEEEVTISQELQNEYALGYLRGLLNSRLATIRAYINHLTFPYEEYYESREDTEAPFKSVYRASSPFNGVDSFFLTTDQDEAQRRDYYYRLASIEEANDTAESGEMFKDGVYQFEEGCYEWIEIDLIDDYGGSDQRGYYREVKGLKKETPHIIPSVAAEDVKSLICLNLSASYNISQRD